MSRSVRKIVKRILLGLLIILVILVVIYRDLVGYGIQQGYGQLHIVWNAKPVEDIK